MVANFFYSRFGQRSSVRMRDKKYPKSIIITRDKYNPHKSLRSTCDRTLDLDIRPSISTVHPRLSTFRVRLSTLRKHCEAFALIAYCKSSLIPALPDCDVTNQTAKFETTGSTIELLRNKSWKLSGIINDHLCVNKSFSKTREKYRAYLN